MLGLLSSSHAADDSAIEQIIANATKNQDAQTSAEVRSYVNQHHSEIQGIVDMYVSYLKQMTSMVDDPSASTSLPATTSDTTTSDTASQADSATSSVQASGPLKMSHLDGTSSSNYTALPEVAPTSSITKPTVEQLAQGFEVNRKIAERKLFYRRLAGVQ
ncbi:MAG: hypothetical protein QM796_05330 [Chthoniobacteraceae bacterium]